MTSRGAIDHLIRRRDLFGKSVPVPVDVEPGEGLAELLFRAASVNGYRKFPWFGQLLGLGPRKTISPFSVADLLLDASDVSDILGNSGGGEEIAALMTSRVNGDSGVIQFFGAYLRSHALLPHRRVSPRALREAEFQRAIWSIRDFQFDPYSLEMLLDACPKCKHKLDFYHTSGPSYCGRCAFVDQADPTDLRDYPQPLVEVADDDALRFVADLVNPIPENQLRARARLGGGLEHFGRGEVFEVICYFARQLSSKQVLRRLLPPSPDDLARSARAVLNWPDGFHQIAWELRQKWGKLSPARSRVQFRLPRCRNWKQMDELLASVVREAERSIRNHAISQLSPRQEKTLPNAVGETIDLRIANPNMGLPRLLERMRALGHDLTVDNAHVMANVLRTSRYSRELAMKIGMPLPYLGECFTWGIVACLDENARTFFPPREPPQNDLFERLEIVAERTKPPINCLTLSEAISVADFTRANCWPTIFKAMLSRELPVWLTSSSTTSLARRILLSDLDALQSILRGIHSDKKITQLELTDYESAMASGFDRSVIETAVAAGAIDRRKKLSDLWDFKEKWVVQTDIQRRFRAKGIFHGRVLLGKELESAQVPSLTLRHHLRIWDRKSAETHFGLEPHSRSLSFSTCESVLLAG